MKKLCDSLQLSNKFTQLKYVEKIICNYPSSLHETCGQKENENICDIFWRVRISPDLILFDGVGIRWVGREEGYSGRLFRKFWCEKMNFTNFFVVYIWVTKPCMLVLCSITETKKKEKGKNWKMSVAEKCPAL